MATATRPGRGPKEYTPSILQDVLTVLDGPIPERSRLSGKDVIKAAYKKILAWRSEGISYEEIAQIFAEKVPSFKLTAKVLRRYMADLELELAPEKQPTSPIADLKTDRVKAPSKPKKSQPEEPTIALQSTISTTTEESPKIQSKNQKNPKEKPEAEQFNSEIPPL